MTFIYRVISVFLSAIFAITGINFAPAVLKEDNFRVVSYIVGSNIQDEKNLDTSHFSQVTDLILFGTCSFDTEGNVNLNNNFEKAYNNLKNSLTGYDINLYLNITGPGYKTSSTVWEEQMKNQSYYHNLGFKSGVLEGNIKDVLDTYDFDGIFFDYEYPVQKSDWKVFSDFLVSLDECIGDEYKIGAAISPYNNGLLLKGINVLDMVEVMAYDMWDNNGFHSSVYGAKNAVRYMLLQGYRKPQLDMGIPFYGRPTTQEAYWYSYAGNADKLDENGYCVDPETGLTFSFNNYETVYEKTEWAKGFGLGGVMVWHYNCDISADNDNSLFNAIYAAKTDSNGIALF